MDKYFESFNRLNAEKANNIKIDSEKLFAVTFLNWFGNEIPLYNKLSPIRVIREGKNKTVPDFVTPYQNEEILFYEVTRTANTKVCKEKRGQRKVLALNQIIHPNQHHLEINGNALQCPDYLMSTLEKVYFERMDLDLAQININSLGRNHNFFLSVLGREMAAI